MRLIVMLTLSTAVLDKLLDVTGAVPSPLRMLWEQSRRQGVSFSVVAEEQVFTCAYNPHELNKGILLYLCV
jgi:hypothetical protein